MFIWDIRVNGRCVSSAGDVNGDGIDDIVIGSASKSYVVYGRSGDFETILEMSDDIGTKDFKPYQIKDRFTDRSLKLRKEGETGRSWTESEIRQLSQIDLGGKAWHAYDGSYGTDQEKHFKKYIHDQEAHLRSIYEDFYLLRNEKAVKLLDFDTGRAFVPDFVLFLRKKGQESTMILHLFIEPKGDQLRPQDDWKKNFLMELKNKSRIETVFQGRDYTVLGLPFFNEGGRTNTEFRAAFEDLIT